MTPRDPLDPSFWLHERKFRYEAFNDLVLDTMLAGMSNAVPIMPSAIQPLISWEVVNQAALAWLRQYEYDVLNQIDIVTEKQARQIIGDWVNSGQPLNVLNNELAPIFGRTRAEAIASTEVTRIFAQGNLMVWQSTGVVGGKVWQTARDERVCPFCGPLHNQIVEINADFSLTADTMAESPQMKALLGSRYTPEAALAKAQSMLASTGASAPAPPYHPRCRCWLKPVVDVGLVEAQFGLLATDFFAAVRAGSVEVSHG